MMSLVGRHSFVRKLTFVLVFKHNKQRFLEKLQICEGDDFAPLPNPRLVVKKSHLRLR